MRWFINYLRQCFCKHKWVYEECDYKKYDAYGEEVIFNNIKVSQTCKECGYHKSYFKF